MDVVILALRVLVSLAVVFALLFLLHRKVSKLNGNRAGATLVSVVARQGLGAKASMVVVDAEGTRFYLGVTEQSVSVLHSSVAPRALKAVAELDDVAAPAPARQLMPEAPETPVAGMTPRALQTVPEAPDAGFAASLRLAASSMPAALSPSAAPSAPPASAPSVAGSTPEPGTRRAARAAARTAVPLSTTPLQGSILSPATWKQTASFLRQGRAG